MRTAIAACLLLALGGAVWFLGFGGGAPGPRPGGFESAPLDERREIDDTAERSAPNRVAVGDAGTAGPAGSTQRIDVLDLPTGSARVVGRVVDPLGNPLPDVDVKIGQRPGRGAFFAMFGGDGPRPDMREMFRGDRGDMRERFRDLTRSRPLAEDAIRTGPDGRFEVPASLFREAELTVVATHPRFAPSAVERTFDAEADGEVCTLEDVVLETGITVSGIVVDDANRPVPGAMVAWRPESEDAGDGNFFGRGGPEGFGPPDRGGRGGPPWAGGQAREEALREALPAVATAADGSFVLGPVPASRFGLDATAAGHLDGDARRLTAAPGALAVPGVQILLIRAAALSGVVRSSTGQPVAGATVRAEFSRQSFLDDMRATRERDAAAGVEPERRGRRGEDADPAAAADRDRTRAMFGAREETETDAEGRFELSKLPPGPVRLVVDHDDYLEITEDPIDPIATRQVALVMPEAPYVAGVVVDAATGQPIETFGVAVARYRDPAQPFGGRGGDQEQGGRRGRGGERQPDAEQQAADAARAAAQTERAEWLRARLGPAGRPPGRTPDPTRHEAGEFALRGLESGSYVVDVHAPGYVRTSSAPVDLEVEPVEGLVIRVERGVRLTGTVTGPDGAPVADAEVRLSLPEPPGAAPQGGPDLAMLGMRGGRGGMFGGGLRLASARTDAAGRYELEPQRAGTYRVQVEASDYLVFERADLALQSGDGGARFDVRLSRGGRLAGTVTAVGETELRGAMVTARHADGETFRARVDAETGGYELTGLPAGGYFLSVNGRSGDFRERIAEAVAKREQTAPDVYVGADAVVRHDLMLGDPDVGIVTGYVTKNGAAFAGARVRLERTDAPAAAQPLAGGPGGPGGPGGRIARALETLVSATADDEGRFTLTAVPPGSYDLIVSEPGRGGRGGQGGGRFGGGNAAVHREPVAVAAQRTVQISIQVRTAEVEFRVTAKDGALPERMILQVALAAEVAADADDAGWRAAPSARMVAIREGSSGVQSMPPGFYRYRVRGRDVAAVTGEFGVAAGSPSTVAIEVTPAPAPAGAGNGSGGN